MAGRIDETGAANDDEAAQRPQLVCLDIDRIHLYDRNPRTTRNPEYERIKQSILANGLEQPLIVARRPGQPTYIVTAGGNTRLQILKELYAASLDPEFSMVSCIEVGWQDEADVLLGHLRENNLRGDLSFADKAAAVVAFADMAAEERGGQSLTGSELHRALKERGFPVSKGLLSYMRYAAVFLMPAMPVALSSGLGSRSIARIRKLHRAAGNIWVRRGIGPESEFDDIFAELCRRHDGPDWQLEPLSEAVELELAEAAELPLQTVRLSLQVAPSANGAEVAADSTASSGTKTPVACRSHETARNRKARPPRDVEADGLTIVVQIDDEPPARPQAPGASSEKSRCPFAELRQRAYGLAHGLASRFGLGGLVLPLADCGNGFLIADVPDADMLATADARTKATIGTMWWQLVAFSETANAPPALIEARLPSESSLRTVLEQQHLELLFDRVEIVEVAYIADQFWGSLPAQDWQDWLYLAHTHRELRAKVIETERPLWSRSS